MTHITSTIALSLLVGCTQFAAPPDTDAATGRNPQALDGDAVWDAARAWLAEHPEDSVPMAFERAVDQVAGLGVEPYPSDRCTNDAPAHLDLFQNPDWLGATGVAHLLALQAQTGSDGLSVTPLGSASVTRDEVPLVVETLATTQSPDLVTTGLDWLASNPHLDDTVRAQLASHLADVSLTKIYRTEAGDLLLPDLDTPVEMDALVKRLVHHPSITMRRRAIGLATAHDVVLSPDVVDEVLDAPSYHVRSTSGAVVWQGSDTSRERIDGLIAWWHTEEAWQQAKLTFVLGQYILNTPADIDSWADDAPGIYVIWLEAYAAFLGDALRAAPDDAEIQDLAAAALQLEDVSNLYGDALRALGPNDRLTRAEKLDVVAPRIFALLEEEPQDGLEVLWTWLGADLLGGQLEDEDASVVSQLLDTTFAYSIGDEAWPDLRARLLSEEEPERVQAALELALALPWTTRSGVAGALLHHGLSDSDRDLLLDTVGRPGGDAVAEAALAAGVDPQLLLELLEAREPFGPYAARTLGVVAEAASHPDIGDAEAADTVVAWVQRLNSYTLRTNPSGVRRLLALLDEVSDSARQDAWERLLVTEEGRFVSSLLPYVPKVGPSATQIREIAGKHVASPAATCRKSSVAESSYRPAVNLWTMAAAVSPPSRPLDVDSVIAGRVQVVRTASADGDDLVSDDLDVLLDTYDAMERYPVTQAREEYQLPAQELLQRLLASTDEQEVHELGMRLVLAEDLQQLPGAELGHAIEHISAHNEPLHATSLSFGLDVAWGTPYDDLADRYRHQAVLGLPWHLADEVRSEGQQAALERLLATTGRDFGGSVYGPALAAQSIHGADVSSRFRQGMLEVCADDKVWSCGTLPMVRAAEEDLDFLVRGDAVRMRPYRAWRLMPSYAAAGSLYGTVLDDPRLSAKSAVTIAWNRLSLGRRVLPAGIDRYQDDVLLAETVDAVLAVRRRPDVDDAAKQELGRALVYVLTP